MDFQQNSIFLQTLNNNTASEPTGALRDVWMKPGEISESQRNKKTALWDILSKMPCKAVLTSPFISRLHWAGFSSPWSQSPYPSISCSGMRTGNCNTCFADSWIRSHGHHTKWLQHFRLLQKHIARFEELPVGSRNAMDGPRQTGPTDCFSSRA